MPNITTPNEGNFSDLLHCTGCIITKTEYRAISLLQLEQIVQHVRNRLLNEVWTVPRGWGAGMIFSRKILDKWCKGVVESVDDSNCGVPVCNVQYETGECDVLQMYEIADRNICRIKKTGQYPHGFLHNIELTSPEHVTLYDVTNYVIKPATLLRQCSMVELMAFGEQHPDYFVSHWWGEPVLDFVACLKQHARDRGLVEHNPFPNMGLTLWQGGPESNPMHGPEYLGGRSPHYWVCAYANNQHRIHEEIAGELESSSFFRAMEQSKGTVSVVDADGVSWSRIWCCFELYHSLVVKSSASTTYTYDMYTAVESVNAFGAPCSAVGITSGNVHEDYNEAGTKAKREQGFPIEMLDMAISFRCADGEASQVEDKEKILAAIATEGGLLDEVVHGVVAAAAIERVLKLRDAERCELYLGAIQAGRVKAVSLNLAGSDADCTETWSLFFASVGRDTCESLTATSAVLSIIPDGLMQISSLKELHLLAWSHIHTLPDELHCLVNLQILELSNCDSFIDFPTTLCELTSLQSLKITHAFCLQTLPEGLGNLQLLQHLAVTYSQHLTRLPDGLCSLVSLKSLILDNCTALEALPEEFGSLQALQELSMCRCRALTGLPPNLGHLQSLTALKLEGCTRLHSLPSSFKSLHALTELNLSLCVGLASLPFEAGLSALRKLDLTACSNLTTLPEGLSELQNLTHLGLGNCSSLQALPEGLPQLSQLVLMRCSALTRLPAGIKGDSVQGLNLMGCSSLIELHPNICHENPIMALQLQDCTSLTTLPEDLGRLSCLTSLSIISCGQLEYIPDSLVRLAGLTTLLAGHCTKLTTLPEGLHRLTALTFMDLSGCTALVSLPQLEGLSALHTLSLLGCSSLQVLPDGLDAIATLTMVTELCHLGCVGCSRCHDVPQAHPTTGIPCDRPWESKEWSLRTMWRLHSDV